MDIATSNSDTFADLDPGLRKLHNYALAVYLLYITGFVLGGITTLAGFILALVKGREARGSYLDAHFRRQQRSFLWGIFWGLVGLILNTLGIGYLIIAVVAVWLLYIWIKGLLNLTDLQPA